ncbi:MAG: TlpA disulfide reductase family protein [Burkholderiales bacterium]
MKRRSALIAGVAAAGAGAGVATALWRSRGIASAADTALWDMVFDKPSGGSLALNAFRGRPLLLNFWATWCPPCVAELPLLDRFHREQAANGWQVAGLAVDNLAPVLEFLGKRPVTFAIGLAGAGGIELARGLGNTGGALPFTAVFDRQGRLAQRKLGVIAPEDLEAWVKAIG